MFAPSFIEMLAYRADSLVCIAAVAVIVFLATCTRKSGRPCPRCRRVNLVHARFCGQCGQRL